VEKGYFIFKIFLYLKFMTMKKKSSLFAAIQMFIRVRLVSNWKWLCFILPMLLSSVAFSQPIILTSSALYANVSGEEITLLQPYIPGTAYDFKIPLIGAITDRTVVSFDNISPDHCSSAFNIVTSGPENGSFNITASGCPFDPDIDEIRVEVDATWIDKSQHVTFIIPCSHSAVKIALVLDISGSMGEHAYNVTDTRWNVLSAAVLGFTQFFESFNPYGDSGCLTYFTTDTIQPHSPILQGFIPIYPESHTPASEKYSELVKADMAPPRHPLYTTAMGKGLLDAKKKLSPGSDVLKKSVVLFTDGLQNVHPFVDPLDGNSVEGGLFLNDPTTTDRIKYYTIGIQSDGDVPIVLNKIATASDGIAKQTNNSTEYWSGWFQDIFVKILSGSSPQIVFREKGTFEGTEKSHQFVLNNNIKKLVVRLEFPSNSGLTMTIIKDGINLTSSVLMLKGPFYQHISLTFPIKKDSGYLRSQGNWSIKITGDHNCDYNLVAMADDHHLDYVCKTDKPLYTVGDSLLLSVNMKYKGKPLADPANNISALILKPGEDIGDLLARAEIPALRDTSVDASSAAQQKFLYLIQTDTAFANALIPTKQLIRLVQTDSGMYKGIFSSTDFTGIYKVHFIMNGIIPDKGNFERLEVQDALFKFGLIDPAASAVSVAVDTTQGGTTANVSVRPINKFGKYLGPGFDSRIKIDLKDRKSFWKPRWAPLKLAQYVTKSGVKSDTIQLRKIKDNLNGSYDIILANIPDKHDPVIRITVMGEVIRSGRLSQICKPHSCEKVWIVIITILVLLLLILKYILNKGILSKTPKWLIYLIILAWLLILILQRAGLMNFPGSSCF
jgi:hypothetical protein